MAEVSKLTTTYKIIKAFSLSKIHPPCNHKNVHGLDCLDFVFYLWAGPVRIARSANSQTTRILAKCDCFRPWKKKRLARMLQGQFVRRWARRECVCCAAAMFVAKSPVASFKKKKSPVAGPCLPTSEQLTWLVHALYGQYKPLLISYWFR